MTFGPIDECDNPSLRRPTLSTRHHHTRPSLGGEMFLHLPAQQATYNLARQCLLCPMSAPTMTLCICTCKAHCNMRRALQQAHARRQTSVLTGHRCLSPKLVSSRLRLQPACPFDQPATACKRPWWLRGRPASTQLLANRQPWTHNLECYAWPRHPSRHDGSPALVSCPCS